MGACCSNSKEHLGRNGDPPLNPVIRKVIKMKSGLEFETLPHLLIFSPVKNISEI